MIPPVVLMMIIILFLLKLVKILKLLTIRLGSYSRDEFLLDESL